MRNGKSAGPLWLALIAASLLLCSCKREQRGFHVDPPAANAALQTLVLTPLHAGLSSTNISFKNDYEDNSYAISQGQHLYNAFNCVGCHAHGGGDKGPPLMDTQWIYGSDSEQIFASIVQGRPNGMPSFRGRIPDYQVWELVAYVRSLSGLTSRQASSGRDDHMQTSAQAPNSASTSTPKNSFVPSSTQMPK